MSSLLAMGRNSVLFLVSETAFLGQLRTVALKGTSAVALVLKGVVGWPGSVTGDPESQHPMKIMGE